METDLVIALTVSGGCLLLFLFVIMILFLWVSLEG
jgi:hypothetical protein